MAGQRGTGSIRLLLYAYRTLCFWRFLGSQMRFVKPQICKGDTESRNWMNWNYIMELPNYQPTEFLRPALIWSISEYIRIS